MQRSLRRPGAVQSYACQIVRSYAAEGKGSGRYPHLQEPGKSAKSSVQSKPGNHAYPPTGGVEANTSSKTSSASKSSESATATTHGNHAYPPTAGASSGTKPPSTTQSTTKAASESTSSKSAESSTAFSSQGKDTKAGQAGSPADRPSAARSPASHEQSHAKGPPAYKPIGASAPVNAKDAASGPSSSTASPSAPAGQQQGQPKGPPAYKPIGASAPLNAEGASSSKPTPSTAGAAGNHAYPPTAGASASSSGRDPPSGSPSSGPPPSEPLPGGKNKWRLHPYFPIDVRLLSTALLGLGAYYFYFPPTSDQHQPNAGDGRVFGSPDSREPEPKQLEDPEGEPIPLDMATVAKHAQRLGQHSNSDPSSKEREQHQPYASDGRVLGSSESQEPTPGQDEHGEPLPFDESAAAKHAQRLQQRSKGEGGQEHQPNAGDGRVLGSAQSQEPEPQLRGDGEPLPFDDSAAAKHAKRLGQHAEQRQPNAGDGRVFGSSHSREPNPEQLDNGEDLPVDDGAVARHAQRLSQHSNQRESPDAEQHQPNAADGRVLGSEQSQEPKPKQQADGEPLPLDLDAVDKHQQRLEAATRQRAQEASQHQPRVGDGRKLGSADSVEPEPVELDNAEPHQPRVGDGRKMGSSDSKEPKPVAADSGEPMPLDQEAVARHQRRLEERVKQDQARHENAHDDEFAISGGEGDKSSSSRQGGKQKGSKEDKPVYVDAAPLAALFQVTSAFIPETTAVQEALGGSSGPAPAQSDQLKQNGTSREMDAGAQADDSKKTAQQGLKSAAQRTEDAEDAVVDGSKSAAQSAKGATESTGHKAKEAKDAAKIGAKSAVDSAKAGASIAGQKAEDVKDSAKSAADSAKDGAKSARQKAEEAKDSAKSVAKSAADASKEKAEDVKESAKSAAESAANSAKSGIKSTRQKAEEVKDSAKSGPETATDAVSKKTEEARDSAKFGADSAADSVADSAKAGGKAAGQQAEEVKETSKSGAETAGDKAREAKDSAKSSAESAAGKAGKLAGSAKSVVESTAEDTAAATGDADEKSKRKTKGRAAIDEAMHVVKESMNDIGGLGYFHDKTNKVKDDDLLLEEEVEEQPSAEQAQQKAVEGMHHLTESHGPAADLPSRPILGVHEDLSGAALVRRAIEGGQGAGDNWTEFKYRHRQAEQDSQLLYATLQQAEQFHQAEVERLEQLVDAEAARGDYILEAAQDNIDGFAQALDQQAHRHQRSRQAELQRQRQGLTRAAAQELVNERRQRMTALKEIRRKLRSLEGLLQFRGNEQHISHTAHKLSIGAFALQTALDKGAPFETELEYLAEGCQADPLVQTAVLSFPQQTALKGIPTRAQLMDRWATVSRAARQLSTIPQAQGGPLSIAVATLASALKLREDGSGAGPEGLSQGGIETHLAYAESCLVNGQLSTAAAHIQKLVQGTEAAPLVQDWVKATQSRAMAEQTSALLQAHAATLAASLSQS